MHKVGICGHFGENKNLLNGQTIKTKILTEELKNMLGGKAVITVDTYGWKKNPFALLIKCCLLIKQCNNIVILPAQNGVKVFVPLFLMLNKIFNRKLHYVVIGGWLPELLRNNDTLKEKLKKFNGIYVETNFMVNALKNMGLNNIKLLPNFKRLYILTEYELIYQHDKPYKLCTFSRVTKEKGIEDAVEAVISINNKLGKTVYTLDIYGQIDENYRARFEKLKKAFPSYISYKGKVNYKDSVKVLKNYFALLFPTYYEGEGFAGTILDAYASGVPVIATDWKYNAEIIKNNKDGIIFECKNVSNLVDILYRIQASPDIIFRMKKNCLKRARQYTPEKVVGDFITYLQEEPTRN